VQLKDLRETCREPVFVTGGYLGRKAGRGFRDYS
jgi:hypothetical protein